MEKYRKNVYCEKQFLKSYLQKIKDDCGDSNQRQLLNSIKDIITNPYVKLYIDFTKEYVEYNAKLFETNMDKSKISDYDRFMYEMFQKQSNNEIQLKSYQKEEFEDVEKIDLNALYMLDVDNGLCDKLKNEFGVTAINIENLDDYNFALEDQGKAIAKGDKFLQSWKNVFERTKMLPYNAIIIVDNYILNDERFIEENIECILDTFIPQKLKTTFQITIVTSLDKPQCNKRYETLDGIIKKLRPNLGFEFTIIKSQDFHDRTILTNSMFIGCGAGFDIFKKKQTQKTTTVNVASPLWGDKNIKWVTAAYSNLMNDIRKVSKTTPEYDGNKINETMPNFYIGNKSNRIIE